MKLRNNLEMQFYHLGWQSPKTNVTTIVRNKFYKCTFTFTFKTIFWIEKIRIIIMIVMKLTSNLIFDEIKMVKLGQYRG